MSPRNLGRRNVRKQLTRESARIMVEGGIKDYQLAKRKPTSQLGMRARGQLPANDETEVAVQEYQRLFRKDQPDRLLVLRQAAVGVMRLLTSFDPCLVGPVLNGRVDEHSEVVLHVFSDTVEAVSLFLGEYDIPYRLGERHLRTGAGLYRRFPSFQFAVDDVAVELLVFDQTGPRQSPLSPVAGKPMPRARVKQVEALAPELRTEG